MELECWNMDPLVPTPSILYWTVALNVLRNDESFVSSKQFYKQVFESQGSFNSYIEYSHLGLLSLTQ